MRKICLEMVQQFNTYKSVGQTKAFMKQTNEE